MELVLELRLRPFRAGPNSFRVVSIECSGGLGVVPNSVLV